MNGAANNEDFMRVERVDKILNVAVRLLLKPVVNDAGDSGSLKSSSSALGP